MTKEFLVRGLQPCELDAVERSMIAEHGTMFPNGYNVEAGGRRTEGWKRADGGVVHGPRSEATKQRISATCAERREILLSEMSVADADKKRVQLHEQRERKNAKRRGEEPADGRFGQKRKERHAATIKAKQDAKMALMSPEEAAAYKKKIEKQARARAKYRSKGTEIRPEKYDWARFNAKRLRLPQGISWQTHTPCDAQDGRMSPSLQWEFDERDGAVSPSLQWD